MRSSYGRSFRSKFETNAFQCLRSPREYLILFIHKKLIPQSNIDSNPNPLQVVTRPLCWIHRRSFIEIWDAHLARFPRNYYPDIDRYHTTIELKNFRIWRLNSTLKSIDIIVKNYSKIPKYHPKKALWYP